MTRSSIAATVVGVDVGGERKGFHGVALQDGKFIAKGKGNLAQMVAWIAQQNPGVVAIDAPCRWSKEGGGRSSRRAERDLILFGTKLNCFSTPTRTIAGGRDFYKWVSNGQTLYKELSNSHPLFLGKHAVTKMCIETFPQAVVCALAGKIVSAEQKATRRRAVLRARSFDPILLTNIDFVDAGLCAIAAAAFLSRRYQAFGDAEEGYIVVPA